MESDIEIRQSKIGDLPDLHKIWNNVFACDDEELFFGYHFSPEKCFVADFDGRPGAMGFLLPAGTFNFGENRLPCAMVYALATLPEHRKNGIASAILRKLISSGRNAGYPITILCPSDDGLFDYYLENSEFREMFYISEKKYGGIEPSSKGIKTAEIDTGQYMDIRNAILQNTPHIEMNHSRIEYQRLLSADSGGALLKAEIHSTTACAAIEKEKDGTILIKELLAAPEYEEKILSFIAEAFPSHQYIVRTPTGCRQEENTDVKRFGMMVAPQWVHEAVAAETIYPWYGFAYD